MGLNFQTPKNLILFAAPVALFLLLWETGGRAAQTPLFPPFSRVVLEFFFLVKTGVLLKNLGASFARVAAGFALGSAAGFLVGVAMGLNRTVELSLRPLISILFPIPTLAWLPLLMLWVGISEALPVTLIFICAFFPVVYNTLTGIKGVDNDYIKAASTLGASPQYIFWRVILPMALPNIFTGLRLEAGMVWRTVIAAEMFAIPTGIGALMANAENLIRVDIIMTCMLVLSSMCFVFEYAFLWLERVLTKSRF